MSLVVKLYFSNRIRVTENLYSLMFNYWYLNIKTNFIFSRLSPHNSPRTPRLGTSRRLHFTANGGVKDLNKSMRKCDKTPVLAVNGLVIKKRKVSYNIIYWFSYILIDDWSFSLSGVLVKILRAGGAPANPAVKLRPRNSESMIRSHRKRRLIRLRIQTSKIISTVIWSVAVRQWTNASCVPGFWILITNWRSAITLIWKIWKRMSHRMITDQSVRRVIFARLSEAKWIRRKRTWIRATWTSSLLLWDLPPERIRRFNGKTLYFWRRRRFTTLGRWGVRTAHTTWERSDTRHSLLKFSSHQSSGLWYNCYDWQYSFYDIMFRACANLMGARDRKLWNVCLIKKFWYC